MNLGAHDHYGFALVALVGTFLASWALIAWMHDPRRATWLAGLDGVAPPFINIIGVLFALTLAFLANDTWSAHDRATTAVFREADSLRAIVSLTRVLPDSERLSIEGAVSDYARAAVDVEWPLLARRRHSPETSADLDRLLGRLAARSIGEAVGPAVHARLLAQAMEVREARDQRIALSQTHVNPLKWLGMAFLGFVTMLSVAAVHVTKPRAALVAILLFAAAAGPTAAIVLV
ncbi:MAG: DUF4239 domain-containing protein [Siculibacillus sp.]|nr:DUF4239 domain-containing protein [Siculibacillus sp.]